jgi:hypothetical protein
MSIQELEVEAMNIRNQIRQFKDYVDSTFNYSELYS